MLLFIKSAMLGAITSQDSIIILGPMPSRPVHFPGSSLRMRVATCYGVMSGIWKKVSEGTLLLT